MDFAEYTPGCEGGAKASVCVALLCCDTETELNKISHLSEPKMQLVAVLLHHSIPAADIDIINKAAVADSAVTPPLWSVIIPVCFEESLSRPDAERAIVAVLENCHDKSVQLLLKGNCIVVSGNRLDTLLQVLFLVNSRASADDASAASFMS
jgi:hypothetical protein